MGAVGCRILGEEWNQNFLLVQWRHFLSKDSVCVFQLRLFVFIVCYIALLSHVVLLYSEITLLLLLIFRFWVYLTYTILCKTYKMLQNSKWSIWVVPRKIRKIVTILSKMSLGQFFHFKGHFRLGSQSLCTWILGYEFLTFAMCN